MLLAWKNAHRFEASTFLLIDSVWAPLPSVSDSARHSAITAISRAILRFSLEASLAWSACSMLSCALMILSLTDYPTMARTIRPVQEASEGDGIVSGESAARMRGTIDFEQALAVDPG